MRTSRRLLVAFLLIFLFPLLLAQAGFYLVSSRSLAHRALSHLESVAAIQEKRLAGILAHNLERLALVQSRTQLRLSLAELIEDGSPEHRARMDTMLRDSLDFVSSFEAISVLTLDGKLAASTDPAAAGADRSGEEAFLRGRRENSADTLVLDEKNGLMVLMSGRLVLDGRTLGVVVVRSRADSILSAVNDYTGLGDTGETVLARSDEGGNAIFLTPLRFDPGAALRRTVPSVETDAPIIRALAGEEGLFTRRVDYRGEPVLAATRHLDASGWGLVVKIDRAEALAPLAGLRSFVAVVALLSTAVVAVVALWLERSITRPIVGLLRTASRLGGEGRSDSPEARRTGEIGELTRAFDEAALKLESSRAEMLKINRALRVLGGCNAAVMRSTEEQALLRETCRTVAEVGGYRLAWVGVAEEDESKTVRPVAQAGFEDGYLDSLDLTWADTERGRGPTGVAIREGVASVARNIPTEPRFAPWRTEAAKRGYASSIALPLKADGRAFGALNIYAEEPDAFDEDETRLLEELAENLAHGVAALRTRAARDSAEAALRLSEERYRIVFDAAPVGIGIAGVDGKALSMNRKMEELTGYSREELESLNMVETYVAPDDRRRLMEAVRRGGEVRDFETRLRRKDGTVYDALLNADIVEIGGRQVLMTTARDVTERRRLEAELLRSQKIEAIGRLAGGIAHDFNNMLQVVTGYAHRMLNGLGPDDPARKGLVEIERAGERAATLTRQLLALGRRQVLQPRILDLNAAVERIEEMLGRVLGDEIDLVTVLQPDLGRVRVDPARLEQAVVNLAINARDAMPGGGRLTIETADVELRGDHPHDEAAVPPGAYVMLAVSDTGRGMSEKMQAQIFDPFFTTKKPGEGTGLGLSTVYGTIRQSGGVVRTYSEPAKGTTFRIYLPRVEGAVEPGEAGGAASGPQEGTETILLVEDDATVRSLIATSLRERGYTVLEASNASEAILKGKIREGPMDLLVTDVMLPGRSGREVYEGVQAVHRGVRVLFISGHTERHIVHRGVLDPGTSFLEKPFTDDQLAAKVREVLGGSLAAKE